MELKLKKNEYAGRLIVFEGTDGAGKTTMLDMAANYLRARFGGERVLVEKQPTDLSRKTRLFQKMMYSGRHEDIDYRAVQLLTLSDRVQHNHAIIVPALKAGKIVVCDRYLYTSVANMLARGYREEEWFFSACRCIVKPDLAFLAYVEPALAVSRIRARPQEAERFLDETLLKNVAEEFLRLRGAAGFCVLETDRAPERAFERVKNNIDRMTEGMV